MSRPTLTRLFTLTIISSAAFAQSVPLVQDSYVVPGSAANYGASATLNVGGSGLAEVLVQFDLSNLPTGIAAGNVSHATLALFVHAVGTAGMVNVSEANGLWMEAGVSGNNLPATGAAVASGVEIAGANSYLPVDVTHAIQDWLSGTQNNGFIITPGSAGVSAQFDSKESISTSHPAQLTIYLNEVVTQSSLPGSTANGLALGVGASTIATGASGTGTDSVAYGPDVCNLCSSAGGGNTDASYDVAIGYRAGNSLTTGASEGASRYAVAIGNQATTYTALTSMSNCFPYAARDTGQIAIGSGAVSGCRNAIVIGQNSTHTGADAGAFGASNVGTSVDSWLFGTNVFDNGFAGIAMGNHASLTAYGQVVFGGDQQVFYGGITDLYIGPTQTNYMNGNDHAMSVNPCGGGLGTFESGSGANQPGCSLAINGGKSTGSAPGGPLYFQTSPPGAPGAVPNPLVTRMSISPTGVFNLPGFTAGVATFDASGNLSSSSTLAVNRYVETLHTPSSSSEPCATGTFTDDANYHYVCVSTNTWKRVALSSF
ncbi:MAG TPA: DNRLRE domain-containing protein [Bryobacteraceae bacterium]|nr:DNRLRE domain-containing protein [Bryobacteraceae bacterium]